MFSPAMDIESTIDNTWAFHVLCAEFNSKTSVDRVESALTPSSNEIFGFCLTAYKHSWGKFTTNITNIPIERADDIQKTLRDD